MRAGGCGGRDRLPGRSGVSVRLADNGAAEGTGAAAGTGRSGGGQARGSQASAGQGRVPVCSPSPAPRLVFGLDSALGDLWVTRDRISRRLAPLLDPTPGPAPAVRYLWGR